MRTQLVSFAKGINQVSDKALLEPGFVTCLDNIDIRSGSIRPFQAPTLESELGSSSSINYLSDPSSDVRYLYWNRGQFILSKLPRDYTSELVGDSDRIFFTEYGSTAIKIVSGVPVPLGLRRPQIRPTATTVSNMGIRIFTVSEVTGSGNIAKDTTKSYRIALSTEEGILPATNKIEIKSSEANVSNKLTWSKLTGSDLAVKEVIIFAGDSDKEKRIATVPGTQETYTDNGSVSGSSGELASYYDVDLDFTYCYTFVRNVRGMEDESGPSPLSPTVKSSSARSISIATLTDGLFDSDNLVTGTNGTIAVTRLSDLTSHNTLSITGFSEDPEMPGLVKVTVTNTTQKFSLLNGTFVKFLATTGVLAIKAYEIILPDDPELPHERAAKPRWEDLTYFYVDAPITLGQAISAQQVKRDVSATIASASVDSSSSAVVIRTTEDHCFYTGQKVYFAEPDKTYEVVCSPIDRSKIIIINGNFDRADGVVNGGYGTAMVGRALLVSNITDTPYTNDAVQLTVTDGTNKVDGLYRARTGGRGSFFIDEEITASIAWAVRDFSMKFVPHNDYIYARRLYRIGDSGEFLKVKDINPWVSVLDEAKPTIALGDPITSNYANSGIDITFDVPPTGMTGLTSHYDMKFAIYGNTVRWTENGYPDAWAEQFSQDFKYRPLALVSWDQSLIVFCEDAVYALVGNTSTTMSVSITSAVDGCIAPGSVQATGQGVLYLSKRGIMLYRGGSAECISDSRVKPDLMLGTSNGGETGFGRNYYWLTSKDSYFYRNLAESDQHMAHYDGEPGPSISTEPIPGVIEDLDSFYVGGRYYLYWTTNPSRNLENSYDPLNGIAPSNYQMHTTICVDTYSSGFPITTLGFKPRDVFVTENEEVFFLADNTGSTITVGGGG